MSTIAARGKEGKKYCPDCLKFNIHTCAEIWKKTHLVYFTFHY